MLVDTFLRARTATAGGAEVMLCFPEGNKVEAPTKNSPPK